MMEVKFMENVSEIILFGIGLGAGAYIGSEVIRLIIEGLTDTILYGIEKLIYRDDKSGDDD